MSTTHRDVELPACGELAGERCCQCGANAKVKSRKCLFHYHSQPWLRLVYAALGGGVPGVRNAWVLLPMCRACRFRWNFPEMGAFLFLLLGLVPLIPLGYVLGRLIGPGEGEMLGMVVAFGVWLVVSVSGKLFVDLKIKPRCLEITEEGMVHLRFPNAQGSGGSSEPS